MKIDEDNDENRYKKKDRKKAELIVETHTLHYKALSRKTTAEITPKNSVHTLAAPQFSIPNVLSE